MTHTQRSTKHPFSLYNAQKDYLLTPSLIIYKDRTIPSKKVKEGEISGGCVVEELVARVFSIIAS